MGIVFHSGGIAKNIKDGTNYLQTEYWNTIQVVEHIKKGDMVGFCTGSQGDYILKFREGYPNEQMDMIYPISIRFAIIIDDETLYIRDLFDLTDWGSYCDEKYKLHIENGIYHITLNTKIPSSGIYGDNQEIFVFLQKLDEMPKLTWKGVPQLYIE